MKESFVPDPSINDPRFTLSFANTSMIKYISPMGLSSDKIKDLSFGNNTASRYTVVSGNQLYYNSVTYNGTGFTGENARTELVKVLPSYSDATFTLPIEVAVIKGGAFEGCSNVTSLVLHNPVQGSDGPYYPRLKYIEADAFKDADNLKSFDLTNSRELIRIGAEVFGKPRKLEVNDSGYYHYAPNTELTIKIPWSTDVYTSISSVSSEYDNIGNLNSAYRYSGMYYFYDLYGLLEDSEISGTVVGSSVNGKNAGGSKLALKKSETDETLAGINYHLMTSGTEYNAKVYTSDKTQFIAVVTGLSGETASSNAVVIPSTVVVKGISYEVVAITDTAFGNNESIETLVLPNKNVSYSSDALAGCTKLGIIQYNDIIPFTEGTNMVAALPTPSAKSLIENSNDEEKKG